ncbi:MAG: response regulator transcription factor [Elusimicrobia bacterium]|nr:response regulator transcription factor [Elusimicrobiota bacterium]
MKPEKRSAGRTPGSRARILLVEDHPIVRQGLAQLLGQTPDLEICSFAEDSLSALRAVKAENPDMAIVDISLQSADGLDLVKDLRARKLQLPVLILSMHQESVYAQRAMRAGAQGYVMKGEPTPRLLAAVRKVLAGGLFFSEEVTSDLLRRQIGGEPAGLSPVELLTDKELQIFRLIGQGHATREIADVLHRSVKTIEAHRENMKLKLGIKNSPQLAQAAVEWVASEGRAAPPPASK